MGTIIGMDYNAVNVVIKYRFPEATGGDFATFQQFESVVLSTLRHK